jgi:adenylate cyclase
MSYRTKLFALVLATAVVSELILGGLSYWQFERMLREELASNLRSISLTTAALIAGDEHREVRTRGDQANPAYIKIKDELLRARDANRRADIYVKYMVTLAPAAEDPKLMAYAVDPEEKVADRSNAGDIYRPAGEPLAMGTSRVNHKLMTDAWGTWMTAFAPVTDNAGKTVAELEVDATEESWRVPLHWLAVRAGAGMGIGLLFALIASVILSRASSRPLYQLRNGVAALTRGELDTEVKIESHDEFGELGTMVNRLAEGLRERDAVKRAFAGYVSKEVMESVMAAGGVAKLETNRRRVTVMFADIVNFSTLAERIPPEKVVALLNDFFDAMIDAVIRHQGVPDKLLGDGLMAIFGAPGDDPFQEEHAVRAALDMQERVLALRDKWEADGYGEIRIGVGINSGNAVVGNIGSKQHMEYTAVGDTVNLAARLETATREMDVPILVSEHTYIAVRPSFKWRSVGDLQVKGREDKIGAYAVEALE